LQQKGRRGVQKSSSVVRYSSTKKPKHWRSSIRDTESGCGRGPPNARPWERYLQDLPRALMKVSSAASRWGINSRPTCDGRWIRAHGRPKKRFRQLNDTWDKLFQENLTHYGRLHPSRAYAVHHANCMGGEDAKAGNEEVTGDLIGYRVVFFFDGVLARLRT